MWLVPLMGDHALQDGKRLGFRWVMYLANSNHTQQTARNIVAGSDGTVRDYLSPFFDRFAFKTRSILGRMLGNQALHKTSGVHAGVNYPGASCFCFLAKKRTRYRLNFPQRIRDGDSFSGRRRPFKQIGKPAQEPRLMSRVFEAFPEGNTCNPHVHPSSMRALFAIVTSAFGGQEEYRRASGQADQHRCRASPASDSGTNVLTKRPGRSFGSITP